MAAGEISRVRLMKAQSSSGLPLQQRRSAIATSNMIDSKMTKVKSIDLFRFDLHSGVQKANETLNQVNAEFRKIKERQVEE